MAQRMCDYLGLSLGRLSIGNFPDGEISCKIEQDVRGRDVFLVQSTCPPVNENIMELLIMIDACKRASAERITTVIPYFGYARQDRKDTGRVPITAKLAANLIVKAGADRVLTMDLHAAQIQGFFDGPVDHLTAMPVLIDHLRTVIPRDAVIVSPDSGRVKVAERYAKHLDADVASIYKKRSRDTVNEVEALGIMGDVEGKVCVIVDDMIDTAGTLCSAAEQLTANGAIDVLAATTHGIFSGPAVDRLKNSTMSKVIITNTVPVPSEKQFDKLVVLSIAPVLADALDAVFADSSVSEIFNGENQA